MKPKQAYGAARGAEILPAANPRLANLESDLSSFSDLGDEPQAEYDRDLEMSMGSDMIDDDDEVRNPFEGQGKSAAAAIGLVFEAVFLVALSGLLIGLISITSIVCFFISQAHQTALQEVECNGTGWAALSFGLMSSMLCFVSLSLTYAAGGNGRRSVCGIRDTSALVVSWVVSSAASVLLLVVLALEYSACDDTTLKVSSIFSVGSFVSLALFTICTHRRSVKRAQYAALDDGGDY